MWPNSLSIQPAEICDDAIQSREGEVKWETLDIAGGQDKPERHLQDSVAL